MNKSPRLRTLSFEEDEAIDSLHHFPVLAATTEQIAYNTDVGMGDVNEVDFLSRTGMLSSSSEHQSKRFNWAPVEALSVHPTYPPEMGIKKALSH